jgi:hypothetical protein
VGLQAEYGAARDTLLGALLQEAERLLRSGALSGVDLHPDWTSAVTWCRP